MKGANKQLSRTPTLNGVAIQREIKSKVGGVNRISISMHVAQQPNSDCQAHGEATVQRSRSAASGAAREAGAGELWCRTRQGENASGPQESV